MLLLIRLLAENTPAPLIGGMAISAFVAVGAFVLARRAGQADRQWHPGRYSFETWPVVAGRPTRVTYELRRRNPVAPHPGLAVQLMLREGGTDSYRTVERRDVEIDNERRIEPVTLDFELNVPEAWMDGSGKRRVAIQVSRTAGEFSSAYPIELDVAAS